MPSPPPCRRPGRADEEGRERGILFNWSGHGLMDLAAYDACVGGKLADYELPEEELRKSLAGLEGLPKPAET